MDEFPKRDDDVEDGGSEAVEADAQQDAAVDEQSQEASLDVAALKEMASEQPKPKLIPEDDLNKLRSTYDRKLAQAQQQNLLLQARLAELERQMFEAQIASLPPEEQQQKRAELQQQQQVAQAALAVMLQQQQQQQLAERLEPIARKMVIEALSERYKVPKQLLEAFNDPKEALAAAKVASVLLKRKAEQPTFEGGGGAVASPDVKKQYRNTGDIAGYLRALSKL